MPDWIENMGVDSRRWFYKDGGKNLKNEKKMTLENFQFILFVLFPIILNSFVVEHNCYITIWVIFLKRLNGKLPGGYFKLCIKWYWGCGSGCLILWPYYV